MQSALDKTESYTTLCFNTSQLCKFEQIDICSKAGKGYIYDMKTAISLPGSLFHAADSLARLTGMYGVVGTATPNSDPFIGSAKRAILRGSGGLH